MKGEPIRPQPKGPTRQTVKGRKDREEVIQKAIIRAKCVYRDGYCRASLRGSPTLGDVNDDRDLICDDYDLIHRRSSEWAHLASSRRSKTRGQAAEIRHATTGSLMLCRRHHAQYDGRARPRLLIEALTDRGADGPLRFTMKPA